MIISSCSVLTKTQLEMVENLSFRSDSVANAPKILFEGLSEIRLERGLYYASSLSSPQARAQELGALADGVVEDRKIAEKSQLYVSVLNSYLRALKSASSQSRWSDVGVELRSIGRNIDSLLIRYNKLGLDEEIPTGFAKHAGKTFGLIGEEVMKVKQTNFVKDFVLCGDSLVAERLLIAKLQKEIIADLEQKVLSVQKLSRSIRAKVTRMNNTAKSLDKVDNVIKGVVKVLGKIF